MHLYFIVAIAIDALCRVWKTGSPTGLQKVAPSLPAPVPPGPWVDTRNAKAWIEVARHLDATRGRARAMQ